MPFSKRKMTKIDISDNLSNFNRLLILLKQLLVCYHFDFCYNKLMKTLNLTRERFGRLSVIKKTDKRATNNEFVYICRCDCGKIIESYTSLLRQGRTRSCGCLHRDTRMKDLSVLNAHKKIIDGVQMDMFGNRHNKNNTTGYKGVYKHHKGYIARICVKGVHHRGVTRETIEEAYEDRLALERKYLPKT